MGEPFQRTPKKPADRKNVFIVDITPLTTQLAQAPAAPGRAAVATGAGAAVGGRRSGGVGDAQSKYAVPDHPEQCVLAQPARLSMVEGCKYDFSVIAAMLARNCAFHCPTYRQQGWFRQCGGFPQPQYAQ
jgi:hypothetical protein